MSFMTVVFIIFFILYLRRTEKDLNRMEERVDALEERNRRNMTYEEMRIAGDEPEGY